MLQDAAERDDLAAALVEAVTDDLVVGVVGGGDALQGAVFVGLLDTQVEDVEAVIHLEVIADVRHVKRIEAGLRLPQCRLHLRGLQHLMGMMGRDAQRLATVDDVLAQSEGQRGDALLGLLVADGIVVERAQHAAERRIEAGAVLAAYDLLQDDGHLLLVDDIRRGGHVGLGVLVVDGGVDGLDGTGQHAQHLVLVVQIGHHVGGVDTGEGLVVGVLQQ